MARPLIQIGDEVREMTDAEHQAHRADIAAQVAAIETIAAAKESARNKLKALGLTDAEITALVGA